MMPTLKVGIMNFHFSNYNFGAVMVPYALSTLLKKLGYQPEIINYIPKNISLKKINFTLGKKDSNNYQSLVVDKLIITKINRTIRNRYPSLNYFIQVGKSSLSFPFISNTLNITRLSSIGTYTQSSGILETKSLDLDSSYANLTSSLEFNLNFNDIKSSTYQAQLKNLTIFPKELLGAVGLRSAGEIKIEGKLESNFKTFPTFKGTANWHELFLKRFDVYSGTADLLLKDKTLFYTNGKAITRRNKAIINSSGKFELFNNFNFQTTSHAKNILFSELLYGFGKLDSPVEALLSTNEVHVDGNIFPKKGAKSFEITAKGLLNADNLEVISFDNKSRKKIPQANIALALVATRSYPNSHLR